MNFVDRILELLAQHGISKNKMLTDLHLSKNSIVDWGKRGTIPSGETLSKIAAYFNVSTDYLLGNEQKEKPSDEAESFSKNKKELMALFDSMTDAQQDSFLAIARAIAHELSSKGKSK